MTTKRAILWFRNDLRLHDHEALGRALRWADEVIPVYCIDPRRFGKTPAGFPKTGAQRAQFLLESLADLRARLRAAGAELIVRQGQPEAELPKLAETYGARRVFAHAEVTSEETQTEFAAEQALGRMDIGMELLWGATLYHLNDLPMPAPAMPEIFTAFRKRVEIDANVRKLIETPERVPCPPIEAPGEIPGLAALGLEAPAPDSRAVLAFRGGESAALERLDAYFWQNDQLKVYKETRNGLLGADYSSKFSAWLALGCLSPRKVYHEVLRYERQRVKNDSTYWLIFELIWRDFFRFICKKHGNAVFKAGGLKGEQPKWINNPRLFESWKNGQTGIPFIDANMRELAATGFMSNRGRQNVASFLVHDLKLDWRLGAQWFESQLLDYDVCSNWANWNYVAGVGNDPREDRYFNILSQAKRYDPQGDYLRCWIPELKQLSAQAIHEPYAARPEQLKAAGVSLGGNYPRPVLRFSREKTRV